jgi:polyisoprenoid-binding protein YceI
LSQDCTPRRQQARTCTGGLWALGALAAACPGLGEAAERYTLDGAHSLPEFRFTHAGLTTQAGRFDSARGTIKLDTLARSGSVHYEIDAASLDMGFGTEQPDSPGYRLFDVRRYPKITFDSDRLLFGPNAEVVGAEGTLRLLGIARPQRVRVDHFRCAVNPMNSRPMCAGEISATLKRSEFGMLDYIPAISDDIRIRVPVEAYRN